jgi:hypothetical protein
LGSGRGELAMDSDGSKDGTMNAGDRKDSARKSVIHGEAEVGLARQRLESEQTINDAAAKMLADEKLRLAEAHRLMTESQRMLAHATERLADSTRLLGELENRLTDSKRVLADSKLELVEAELHSENLKALDSLPLKKGQALS